MFFYQHYGIEWGRNFKNPGVTGVRFYVTSRVKRVPTSCSNDTRTRMVESHTHRQTLSWHCSSRGSGL